MASAQAVKEALWLRKLLLDFGVKIGAMKIYSDSQGAIKLLKHPIASSIRSKHFFYFLGGMDIHYTSATIATSRLREVHHKPKRPRLTTHSESVQV